MVNFLLLLLACRPSVSKEKSKRRADQVLKPWVLLQQPTGLCCKVWFKYGTNMIFNSVNTVICLLNLCRRLRWTSISPTPWSLHKSMRPLSYFTVESACAVFWQCQTRIILKVNSLSSGASCKMQVFQKMTPTHPWWIPSLGAFNSRALIMSKFSV